MLAVRFVEGDFDTCAYPIEISRGAAAPVSKITHATHGIDRHVALDKHCMSS